MQPQDGQWTFRFDYRDTTQLSVFVSVTFGPPFSLTTDLSSQMQKTQVESLRDWLTRVLNVMT
jgi:hypothetical protein